ncbi:MAG: S1 RNA-binding domain-containing protein, partial [Deltaproteobacteria bacterium]|nr:S1 RNA-binding domain-containing protein [Deltaproteobacteria bacterium]
MSDEKKREAGPVVVRKGHVKPPPPGVKIEMPVEEHLGAEGEPAAPAVEDPRPLWQRLADSKAGLPAPAQPSAKPASARPSQPGRPPHSPRPFGAGGTARPGGSGGPGGPGARGGSSGPGDRGPRRDGGPRDRRESRKDAGPREPAGPALPPGEPPPAHDAPATEEGSFADMYADAAAAARPRRRFQPGEKVAGKILQIGQDMAFLELGSGLADGMIETIELQDDEGKLEFQPGDIIDGVVVKGGERGVVVTRGKAKVHSDRRAVIEAAQTGLPVEGVVTGANKGGIEVDVMGQRAFCPMSQIDVRFVGDPATLVGQRFRFRVQKADDRDVVLSRRALLEEERAEQAQKTRQRLEPGASFEGTVTSVQDYGAFVDIGGIEGLVHVSELAWDRVSRPGDLLRQGDKVQVQVLKVEEDAKKGTRISLSVKALVPRPEPVAAPPRATTAPPPAPRVGDVVKGTVDRVEPYGVFVRFAGGRGLVPAAETGTPRGQ